MLPKVDGQRAIRARNTKRGLGMIWRRCVCYPSGRAPTVFTHGFRDSIEERLYSPPTWTSARPVMLGGLLLISSTVLPYQAVSLVRGVLARGKGLGVQTYKPGRMVAFRPRGQAPGGRGEESPGSTETRCRLTPGGGDPRESATESRPPAHASRRQG